MAVNSFNAQNPPVNTKGDLFTFSTIPTKLGVGANNTVLTADSTAATGLKWATPASGSLVKISSTTFSNVAAQNIDNVFSSTYNTYFVSIRNLSASTGSDDPYLRFRTSSGTVSSGYYVGRSYITGGGVQTLGGGNNVAQIQMSLETGSSNQGSGWFYVNFPSGGGVSSLAHVYGMYYNSFNSAITFFGGEQSVADTFTGLSFLSSSTNVSGTVVVYGVEK